MNHICFLSSAFGREDALIVYRQGFSLVAAGYKVSYLLCDGLPNELCHGIEIISVGHFQSGIKERLKKHPKYFKSFLENYSADIFQISEPELLPIGLWLKGKGYKVVYNLREWYPDYYARKSKIRFISWFIQNSVELYLRYISKKYDAIFNCMPEMTNYIRKVMPCKYFADVANFPVVNKDFSLSFEEYNSRENIISYFGSIYTISCQEEFLEAISTIPDVKYLLAGIFYSEDYKKKVMLHKGWEKVIFKNGFTREELPGIINCSVIGNVMKDFKKTETPQGSYSIIKIFETMEAAVPVILAKAPLYEEMVEKYHCGICVDPHSVQDVRKAVLFLLNNKREAYDMGQNGRRAVINEFSWDSQAKDYLAIINILLND